MKTNKSLIHRYAKKIEFSLCENLHREKKSDYNSALILKRDGNKEL